MHIHSQDPAVRAFEDYRSAEERHDALYDGTPIAGARSLQAAAYGDQVYWAYERMTFVVPTSVKGAIIKLEEALTYAWVHERGGELIDNTLSTLIATSIQGLVAAVPAASAAAVAILRDAHSLANLAEARMIETDLITVFINDAIASLARPHLRVVWDAASQAAQPL